MNGVEYLRGIASVRPALPVDSVSLLAVADRLEALERFCLAFAGAEWAMCLPDDRLPYPANQPYQYCEDCRQQRDLGHLADCARGAAVAAVKATEGGQHG